MSTHIYICPNGGREFRHTPPRCILKANSDQYCAHSHVVASISVARELICRPWALCTPLFTFFLFYFFLTQLKTPRSVAISSSLCQLTNGSSCGIPSHLGLCLKGTDTRSIHGWHNHLFKLKKKLYIYLFYIPSWIYNQWSCNIQSDIMINSICFDMKLKWVMK